MCLPHPHCCRCHYQGAEKHSLHQMSVMNKGVNIHAKMELLHMIKCMSWLFLCSILFTHGISSPFFINCQKNSKIPGDCCKLLCLWKSQQFINCIREMLPCHIFHAEPLLFSGYISGFPCSVKMSHFLSVVCIVCNNIISV